MKKWDRLAAAVFFLIAAFAAVKAFAIGFGSFTEPGPGFFPFWLAVAMASAAAVYYAANLGQDGSPRPLWTAGTLRRPAWAGVVIAAFAAAIEPLGFCTATFLLFAAWLRLVEGKKWGRASLVAVIGAALTWGLFALLLGLPLPRGLLI